MIRSDTLLKMVNSGVAGRRFLPILDWAGLRTAVACSTGELATSSALPSLTTQGDPAELRAKFAPRAARHGSWDCSTLQGVLEPFSDVHPNGKVSRGTRFTLSTDSPPPGCPGGRRRAISTAR